MLARWILPTCLIWMLTLTACASSAPVPDLGRLYNRSAQDHQDVRNPVILIPGLMGSRLVGEADGRVVWGTFGDGYADPETRDGARRFALPMRIGRTLTSLTDSVRADGSIDRLKVKILGLPIVVDAYSDILSALGVGGYRSPDLKINGSVDYGPDHFTCFQFDYDWRRSNAENAQRLHQFILQKRSYVQQEIQRRYGIRDHDVHFDLVTHSMGALIARYYLRYGDQLLPEDGPVPPPSWAGAELVDRLIMVAPPNAGAVQILTDLTRGKDFGMFLPRYSPAILGTLPSLYELLPRPRHGQLLDEDGQRIDDLYDVSRWEREGWGLLDPDEGEMLEWLLPNVTSSEERFRVVKDHLRKALQNAQRFAIAMDMPSHPPDHLQIDLIAGDAHETISRMQWRDGRFRVIGEEPGGGTVLRSSALLDERVGQRWSPTLETPIHFRQVTFLFTDHLRLTRDPAFIDNMLYMLLESPRYQASGVSGGPN